MPRLPVPPALWALAMLSAARPCLAQAEARGVELAASAAALADRGILLRYTNILEVAAEAEARVREQEIGTHADEIETSMMLYIAPDRVDMRRARKDASPRTGAGGLTRVRGRPGVYSETGIWGDATLATVEKGRVVVEATVAGIRRDLADLREAPLPVPVRPH